MRELNADVEERNYAKEPLTRKEIEEILAAAPSVSEVLNTRHKLVKEKGWKEKAPSKTAFLRAALEDNNLLRRPILIRGKKLVVGKDPEAIRSLLA
ncbi:MAG: hypothetical protein D6731_26005 [Planctomycetota bacterium]|nr:MAG: hypothetical protein D6731_26005 [Planctomycetota bacterium]